MNPTANHFSRRDRRGPGAGSNDPDAGEDTVEGVSGGDALDVKTSLVSGNPDQLTAVANPTGGVFVAGLTSDLIPYIASFDEELAPVWMQRLTGVASPKDLVIDGAGRLVLSAGTDRTVRAGRHAGRRRQGRRRGTGPAARDR